VSVFRLPAGETLLCVRHCSETAIRSLGCTVYCLSVRAGIFWNDSVSGEFETIRNWLHFTVLISPSQCGGGRGPVKWAVR
jgi:hypothetical protein